MVKNALDELTKKLKDGSLLEFDFTEDWPVFYKRNCRIDDAKRVLNIYKNKNPFKKYFIYKVKLRSKDFTDKNLNKCKNEVKNNYPYIIDPDSKSRILQEIYNILWDCENLDVCIDEKGTVHGDTMNTVQTTMNSFYKKNSLGYCLRDMLKDLKDIETCRDSNDKEDELVNFIKANHTLGNFIPCPIGCNSPRGFNNSKIEDYWDLTMYNIWKYYTEDNEEKYIVNIVGEKNKDVYKKYLDSFLKNGKPSCPVFVKKNYLQDFCEEENPNNMPKELWDGHFKGSVLPQNEVQINAFFDNATKRIQSRSEKMNDALRMKVAQDMIKDEEVDRN